MGLTFATLLNLSISGRNNNEISCYHSWRHRMRGLPSRLCNCPCGLHNLSTVFVKQRLKENAIAEYNREVAFESETKSNFKGTVASLR